VEPQLLGGITLIVHFLGVKNLDNSKGGESKSQVKSRGKIVIQNVLDPYVPLKFKVLLYES